jgi:hypothetical protein
VRVKCLWEWFLQRQPFSVVAAQEIISLLNVLIDLEVAIVVGYPIKGGICHRLFIVYFYIRNMNIYVDHRWVVVSMCGSMIKGPFSLLWPLSRCLEGDLVCQAIVPKLSVKFSKTWQFLKGDMLGFHMVWLDFQYFIMRSCDLPANFRFVFISHLSHWKLFLGLILCFLDMFRHHGVCLTAFD